MTTASTRSFTAIHLITAYGQRLPPNRLHPFGIFGNKKLQNPPADICWRISFLLALTKPTSIALAATFFIHYRGVAALGADVTDLHGAVRGGIVVTISI